MIPKNSGITTAAFMADNIANLPLHRPNGHRLGAMVVAGLCLLMVSACTRSPNAAQTVDNGSVESRIQPDGQVSMAVITPAPLPPVAPAGVPAATPAP
ncbi:MAG: hypothetical protein G3H99_00420 [Ferrovum sp.]|nr:hypothetical protein [Ferrovum sp.]NDU88174.1 hypothetical protein [Ferrovum sp.]